MKKPHNPVASVWPPLPTQRLQPVSEGEEEAMETQTAPSPTPGSEPATSTATSYASLAASPRRGAATTAAPASVPAPPPSPRLTTPKVRYPPLVVERLPNWPFHLRELRSVLGYAPNAKPLSRGVRFVPRSETEFRAVQRYLSRLEKSEGIAWFSYSLPAEKTLKAAIRGLPSDTPLEEISASLTELGFKPKYVRQINARSGRPGCLYFVEFERTPGLTSELYKVSELLCMSGVRVEAWRGRNGPAQCHRCQQFRHSSHNCHRPVACVCCGGNHVARACPRPRTDPPTCANCGGDHTANRKSCPVFRREARNRRAGAVALTVPPRPSATAPRVSGGDAPPTPAMPQLVRSDSDRRTELTQGPRRSGRLMKRAQQRETTSKNTVSAAASSPSTQIHQAVGEPRATTSSGVGLSGDKSVPIKVVVELLNRVVTAIDQNRDPLPILLGGISSLLTM